MCKSREEEFIEKCAAVPAHAVSAWRKSDTFALNVNWVSCQSCPLIPLLRLCHCCFLLLCCFMSFRYQWERPTASDREKAIINHLLPFLWLPLTLFFFVHVNGDWPLFPFCRVWYSKHSVCSPCALPRLAQLIMSCIYIALLLSFHCLTEWKLPEVQFVLCTMQVTCILLLKNTAPVYWTCLSPVLIIGMSNSHTHHCGHNTLVYVALP